MKRRVVIRTYRPPNKTASTAWMLICAIGVALLAVMIAAQDASAHDNHAPDSGWFQRCSVTKTGSFDPIVFPGTPPPVGHRHLFFGSTAISHDTSSPEQLQAGDSTCLFEAGTKAATAFPQFGANGGNFSSYWIPDLLVRNGTWAGAKQLNAYYRKGASSIDPHTVKSFPSGLKMLIRDRNNSRTDVRWFCSGLTEGGNGIYRESPYDCDPNTAQKYVSVRITFPQCGNGRLDSADHISHMVFAGKNGCPSTHPHEFVRLSITVKYGTSLGANAQLASTHGGDPAHADPATGFHADYFEAWQPDTLEFFVDRCIRAGINCRDGDRLP